MSDLKVVNEGNQADVLKQFKSSRRLKRKAKRKARISEQLIRDKELTQQNRVRFRFAKPTLDAQAFCRLLGVALATVGALVVIRNAYQQGDNDYDRLLSIARDLPFELGLSVLPTIVGEMWRQRNYILCLFAC